MNQYQRWCHWLLAVTTATAPQGVLCRHQARELEAADRVGNGRWIRENQRRRGLRTTGRRPRQRNRHMSLRRIRQRHRGLLRGLSQVLVHHDHVRRDASVA